MKARDVREVPAQRLRAALSADGLELDPSRHTAFAPHESRLDPNDHTPPMHSNSLPE